ncbi:MAG: VCBS repeat-containing protein [Acidobacteriota bacterium]
MTRTGYYSMILLFAVATTAAAAVPAFEQLRVTVQGEINDLAVGDLNGDGRGDVVTIDHDGKKIRTFMSDSALAFSKQYAKTFKYMGELIIGVADFTGDGKLDVAVDTIYYKTYFSIFPGKGDGSLLNPKAVNVAGSDATEIPYAAVGDFNGDGRPDVAAILDGTPDSISVFLNKGGSKFQPVRVEEADYHGLAAADFDGDGDIDLLAGNLFSDNLTFFQNQGDGSFVKGPTTSVGNTGSHLRAGDLNDDSRPDAVGSGNSAFDGGWSMLGKGDGQFTKKKTLPKYHWLGDGFALVDFTGDGKLDVAEADLGGIALHGGKGTGAFSSLGEIGDGLYFGHNGFLSDSANIAAGDLNGDGKVDIAGAHWDGYNGREPDMTDLVVFINGRAPVKMSISGLSVTTLSFTAAVVNFAGSVSFQNSGGDLRYAGAPVVTDNAFLQFEVELDFPYPMNDYLYTYWTTGSYLNHPGETSGTIAFSLTLPTTVITTATPQVTLSNFSVWDLNLVHSNVLLEDRSRRSQPPVCLTNVTTGR